MSCVRAAQNVAIVSEEAVNQGLAGWEDAP